MSFDESLKLNQTISPSMVGKARPGKFNLISEEHTTGFNLGLGNLNDPSNFSTIDVDVGHGL